MKYGKPDIDPAERATVYDKPEAAPPTIVTAAAPGSYAELKAQGVAPGSNALLDVPGEAGRKITGHVTAMDDATRTVTLVRNGIEHKLVFPLLFVLAFLATGCSGFDAKRAIIVANDIQDSAAHVYNDAKAANLAAAEDCGKAANAASQPLPPLTVENWATIDSRCKLLGRPIPVNPWTLTDLAKPVNALYDGVRAANAIRRAVDAGTSKPENLKAAIATLLDHAYALWRTFAASGIAASPPPELRQLDKEVSR